MLVTIISECSGAAWYRTRRIIDAFLMRIGERCWTGHLTQAGLEQLRRELVQVASRNTAVAAHHAVGTKRTELLWIVGSDRLFSPEGARATYTGHAYDRYLAQPALPVLPQHAMLADAVELAGLWHDVGKANAEFQAKLHRVGPGADSVRHEILSTLAFVDMCRTLPLAIAGPDHPSIANATVASAIQQAINRERYFRGGDDTGVPNGELAPPDLPAALRLVAWLIATHHRLPDAHLVAGRPIADSNHFKLTHHVNRAKFTDGQQQNVRRSIMLDRRVIDADLITRTTDLVNRLIRHDTATMTDDSNWRINSVYGRVALILADRHVSRSDFTSGHTWHHGQRPTADQLIANTEPVQIDDSHDGHRRQTQPGQNLPKQTLIEHLLRVSAESPLTISDLMSWPGQARGLPTRSLPPELRKRSSGRFAWQTEAQNAAKAARRPQAGFFGLLMAGTGAGKTRAIPKILSAIGPELRFTLALSLRSLTLQAGTSYRQELGLSDAEFTTVIGDGAVASLYDQAAASAEGRENAGPVMAGLTVDGPDRARRTVSFDDPVSDADASPADEDSQEQERAALAQPLSHIYDLPQEIARHFPGRDERPARRFLASPIVACTVDQLMAAADARRTSYLVAALRLMSADLVLDEADHYSEMDFVALGRLVYLAGLFGRKVLLSSATIPPAQAKGLFAAYQSGYMAHAKATDRLASIDVGLFGDSGQNLVTAVDDSAAFGQLYQQQAAKIIADLEQRPVLRRAVLLPRPTQDPNVSQAHALFDNMLAALHRVHAHRAETCPRTRRRLSIQLVKVEHVRRAVQIARWMAHHARIADVTLKVIVYHGAFPLLQRHNIETALDQLLRHRSRNLFRQPLVRELLQKSRDPDVMIVVIATGVEEVGRDHDFDGAIIEPTSTRSIIQCCGRVDRHRLRPADQPNIHLFPAPLSFLLADQAGNRRDHYSVESRRTDPIGETFRLDSHWLHDVIDLDGWSAVTARTRLGDDPDQPLVHLEHRRIDRYLNGPSEFALPEFHQGHSQAFLSANHAETMRFRKSQPEDQLWFDLYTGQFRFVEDDGGTAHQIISTNTADQGLGPLRLLDLSSDRLLAELGFNRQRLHQDKAIRDRCQRRAKRYLRLSLKQRTDKPYHYHSDLGAYRPDDD